MEVRVRKATALWLTGLPGSGKSTVASAFCAAHPDFLHLAMDDLRHFATPQPDYSPQERDLLYRCLVYTAHRLVLAGHSVAIDATGHLRKWRILARETLPAFYEVHLTCPLSLCMEREALRQERHGAPAFIYRKAQEGQPVPGVNVPYEEPLEPDLTIDTSHLALDEIVAKIERVCLKGG